MGKTTINAIAKSKAVAWNKSIDTGIPSIKIRIPAQARLPTVAKKSALLIFFTHPPKLNLQYLSVDCKVR